MIIFSLRSARIDFVDLVGEGEFHTCRVVVCFIDETVPTEIKRTTVGYLAKRCDDKYPLKRIIRVKYVG